MHVSKEVPTSENGPARLVDFYIRGLLDLDSIIAERIPLSAINDGFDKMKKGDSARSVIVFDQ